MNNSQNDLYKDLCAIQKFNPFWEKILFELKPFGVTSLSYGAIATHAEMADGIREKSIIRKSSHARKCFDELGFNELGFDQWKGGCFCNGMFPCRIAPVFWHHLRVSADENIPVGFTVSTTNFSVHHLGAISVAFCELSIAEFEAVWAERQGEILHILSILDLRMRNCHLPALIGLSPREEECLTWLASGLRPGQIAHELKIGEGTVDKYIGWARKKLKAGTRDQAIAKAIIFKAIHP